LFAIQAVVSRVIEIGHQPALERNRLDQARHGIIGIETTRSLQPAACAESLRHDPNGNRDHDADRETENQKFNHFSTRSPRRGMGHRSTLRRGATARGMEFFVDKPAAVPCPARVDSCTATTGASIASLIFSATLPMGWG
jgi:hypothetical protein